MAHHGGAACLVKQESCIQEEGSIQGLLAVKPFVHWYCAEVQMREMEVDALTALLRSFTFSRLPATCPKAAATISKGGHLQKW